MEISINTFSVILGVVYILYIILCMEHLNKINVSKNYTQHKPSKLAQEGIYPNSSLARPSTPAIAGTIPAASAECSASWSGTLWPRVEPIHACA